MKTNIIYGDKEIVIEENNKIICIGYDQIDYISTNRPYLEIITTEKRTVLCEQSLSEMQKKLPPCFFRCNRSFIVNLLHICLFQKEKNRYYFYISYTNKKFKIAAKSTKAFKRQLIATKNQMIKNEH